MSTRCNLAYTAGIIDGEGCIAIVPNGRTSHHIRVAVVNTNEWLINWLRFTFGGYIQRHQYCDGRRKDKYSWVIDCKRATDFLALIMPYLKIKKPQAELAILFQGQRKGLGCRRSDEQKALDEAHHILMHTYNKRGAT